MIIPKKLPYLLFLLLIFLALFPVTIVKESFKITPNVLKQGENFTLTVKYCKLLPIPSRFQIVYEGQLIHPTPEKYTSNITMGCHTTDFLFRLPSDLPTGSYQAQVIFEYPPFFRTFSHESEWFTVTKKDKQTLEEKIDSILTIIKDWELDK